MVKALALFLLIATAAADSPTLDAIWKKAESKSWRVRRAAVEQLARRPLGDEMFQVRVLLRTDPRPDVREVIAWAAVLEPRLVNATLLGNALRKDSDPRVRRAAARALANYRDRRAVAALIQALQTERDPRTSLHIVQTLRDLTPAPCLMEPKPWQEWWAKNAADPNFRPADEAPQRATFEGISLETKTVPAVPRSKAVQKPLPHVLVLPPFGWNTAVYGPYLLPLRERSALTWVRLPTIQQLTGRTGYGDDIPVYPVDRLVKALDKFRASQRIDRFLILAPGATGWIAMRYAKLHPDRCAGLILLDTALDREAYAEALQRGAAIGTKNEKFVAKTLTHQNSVPFNETTLARLHAIGLERGFYEPSDLELAHLYKEAREPQGFASVPPLKFKGRIRIQPPTIFVYSAASAFSRHMDTARIAKHFPKSLVTPLREATGLPYVETNPEFHRVLAYYFERFHP